MLTEEELKQVSKLVFLDLCGKVKGHVFTKPLPDQDSIYVNIKKGSLNFECGIYKISDYARNYSKIDFEDMAQAITRRILMYYRIDIMDKYLKNQPTLTLRRNMEKDMIATVKEGYINESVSNGVGSNKDSSKSV